MCKHFDITSINITVRTFVCNFEMFGECFLLVEIIIVHILTVLSSHAVYAGCSLGLGTEFILNTESNDTEEKIMCACV